MVFQAVDTLNVAMASSSKSQLSFESALQACLESGSDFQEDDSDSCSSWSISATEDTTDACFRGLNLSIDEGAQTSSSEFRPVTETSHFQQVCKIPNNLQKYKVVRISIK